MSRRATSESVPWCPTSGHILREFVSAFRLDEPSVGGERAAAVLDRANHPAKRYFAGDWLGPDQRRVVCSAVVDALLNSGILPRLELQEGDDGDRATAAELLVDALVAWLAWWDRDFLATARVCPSVPDRALTALVLARPVVIDVALRLSGALALLGFAASRSAPAWLDRLGGAKLLRALLQEHWPDQTNDVYFVAFGVNERTFDRWISPTVDSEIPISENIDRIADVLAEISGSPADAIRARLRREYGLFAVLRSMADVMGWRLAIHIATALVRMVADVPSRVSTEPLEEAMQRRFALSVLHGAHLQLNAVVVEQLLERGGRNTPWADELRASREGRVRERLVRCLRALAAVPTSLPTELPGLGMVPAELRRPMVEKFVIEVWLRDHVFEGVETAQSDGRHAEQRGVPIYAKKLEMGGLIWRAEAAAAKRDFAVASAAWKRIVELEPADAIHRFTCGAVLWQAGDIAEAEAQLRRSCELAPDWDRPFVEIGILWLNVGHLDRALAHLRSGEAQFRARSEHFNHKEGVVLWQLGRIDDALVALERAIELNPQHAEALDLAARCAFMLLNAIKGRGYARRALHLGRDWSWREFCA